MNDRASEIGTDFLDVSRLQGLLDDELAHFHRDFDLSPVPEVQDLRACFIAWVAVFLPEVVSDAFGAKLLATVVRFRARPDFLSAGWYRVLPLDVALFALTGDIKFLHFHRMNLDHGTSQLRNFLLDLLALVADRLDFEDPELQQRAAHNLEVVHGRCEDCVTMLMVTKGDPRAKCDRLLSWLGSYRVNPHERAVLESLSKGAFVRNPFLVSFLWIQQYVCIRLAEMGREMPYQMAIPGRRRINRYRRGGLADKGRQRRTQMPLFSKEEDERLRQAANGGDLQLGQRLWCRLRNHPLMASHIRLEDMQTQ